MNIRTELTELQWSYKPTDFFEDSTHFSFCLGKLTVGDGTVTCTLDAPSDPLADHLQDKVAAEVAVVFRARQVLVNRCYTLTGPTIIQHGSDGGRSATIMLSSFSRTISSGSGELVLLDSSGRVVSDTRRERIASETEFVRSLARKLRRSATLSAMANSYSQALADPGNALIHLYEVREAMVKHYGHSKAARSALKIRRRDWNDLGRLANDEPLRQGRHRGQYLTGLRDATLEEISLARNIARNMIEGFAATLE